MAKDVAKAAGALVAVAVCAALVIVNGVPGGASNSVDNYSMVKESSTAMVVSESAKNKPGLSIEVAPGVHVPVKDQTWTKLPASIEAKRKVPRMDLHFKKVPNTFCGGPKYTKHQKCSKEYQESLIMTAFPMIIVASLTLLFGILIMIGRHCCMCFGNGCCGGKIPSQGWCWGPRLERDQGYSTYQRRLYFFGVIAILILICIGMGIGFEGNKRMTKGVGSLLDTVIGIPTKVHTQITIISKEMMSLKALSAAVNPDSDASIWDSALKGLKQTDAAITKMGTQAKKAYKTVKKYEGDRSQIFHWAFLVSCIISIVAVLGYFCPILLSCIVVPAVFLITIIVWAAVGVHVPVSVATADFCVNLDYALKHPNASAGALDVLLKCGGKKGAAKMGDAAASFISTAYDKACVNLNSTLCVMPQVSYSDKHGTKRYMKPVDCPKMKCTRATLKTFIAQTKVSDFQWGCAQLEHGNIVPKDCKYTDKKLAQQQCLAKYGNTDVLPCVPGGGTMRELPMSTCATKCLLNETKTLSYKVTGNFEILSRFQALDENKLKPLMNCSIIRQSAVQLEHTLCWNVVDATDYIIAGLSIIGITFFFGNAVYMGATKRFNRKYWDNIYPDTYDEMMADEAAREGSGPGAPLLGAQEKAPGQLP